MSDLLSVFVYSVCQFSQYMAAVHREILLWRAADLFSCPILGSFTTKWGSGIGAVCVCVWKCIGVRPCDV